LGIRSQRVVAICLKYAFFFQIFLLIYLLTYSELPGLVHYRVV